MQQTFIRIQFPKQQQYSKNIKMQETQPNEKMLKLIDKLCDHLGNNKVKVFIDNGFDQWEIIRNMDGQQFIEMKFTSQQCIIIMVTINANAKQFQEDLVFTDQKMKFIIAMAKEKEKDYLEQINAQKKYIQQKINPQKDNKIYIKQYPFKEINQALIWKGTTMKQNKGQKLLDVNMVSLEEKGITHIRQLDKVPNLQILHLTHNHIYKIQGLTGLNKLKTLKLDHNQICKMEGLQNLQLLESLNLTDNHISRIQGIVNNRKLHYLTISNQIINTTMTFDEESLDAMSYCLEKLQCSNNKIKNINEFKYLTVIKEIQLSGNNLQDIGQISQALGAMQMLKTIDFRKNPLCKVHKYRDYIVILSKKLEQLDGKKILPSQREYLVKLYSLKHANQIKEGEVKLKTKEKTDLDLQGKKMEESHGTYKFYQGADFGGNIPYQNTKTQKK